MMNTETKVCGYNVPQKNLDFLDAYVRKVEGFSPYDHCVSKTDMETGKSYVFMPINDRVMWFRMLYKNGKIAFIPAKLDDHFAVVEARVYENVDDPADSYIANAFAMCRADESEYGFDFYSKACSYAAGTALSNAGFNIPVTEWDAETDEIGADMFAPLSPTSVPAPASAAPSDAAAPGKKPRKTRKTEEVPAAEIPAKPISAFYSETKEGEVVAEAEIPVIKVETRTDTPVEAAVKAVEESAPAATEPTPVAEAASAELTWDSALNVEVDADGAKTPLGKLLIFSAMTVEKITKTSAPEAAAAKLLSEHMAGKTVSERMLIIGELMERYGA